MKISQCTKANLSEYKIRSTCNIFLIHAVINDVENHAKELVNIISDKSWIRNLSTVDRLCYEARAKQTIIKLVDEIFQKVTSPVSTDFGEYLVSLSAQDALGIALHHKKVPLAELFKERITGNSGFDFHTESHTTLIAYGEAKYSGKINPYKKALEQIIKFIKSEKDNMELTDLSKFVSGSSMDNAINGKKAYIAAFSINATRPARVFTNIIKSEHITSLLKYPELYLIGVEVNDKAVS